MAILAHPDDESFGMGGALARYAREGVKVHVCIVTDGAAGENGQPTLEGEAAPLARVRQEELESLC